MKLYYDLHIHSALSPCADNSMTPNNIINMAYIKGLDIISVTDHNSYFNVETIMKLGEFRNILVIPGIEVTTAEDIHLLCYFHNVKALKNFGEKIYENLPNIKNKENIFGNQLVLDKEDNKINEIDKLLINASKFKIDDVYHMVMEERGVIIPAHIDKKSYSILSVLGFIPEKYDIKFVEISNKLYNRELIKNYRVIYNSDAHYLQDINEPINEIDIKNKTIDKVLEYFKVEEK
ncbi:PHP domain-containing protein [Clostridium sp. D2Q-14]|uniref:PHP domain-containing protein n=1 Tax=Anaeromonas gelatinilytica TaxID=2683194 RepID=UPI00193AEE0E|nr:PHP domain-containing protein [Anaeromonas gelatinilytica]MBS4535954.1 PHP domain-containing protein [Anaeromonas gelatinilytica]